MNGKRSAMKKLKLIPVIFFTIFYVNAYSQNDSLGLPGDNLDLTAVLGIFKESKNPEEFEKKLNAADTKINNLDLNNDGKVDYLRVIDTEKDGAHSLIIRDPVSDVESQDVAAIEIEKKGDKAAHVQIVGDETLYGKNYIIEPKETAKKTTKTGSKIQTYDDDVYSNDNVNSTSIINAWAWPSVNYLYSPGYVVWVSPWYWGYYPPWYYPWSPYGWYPYRTNIYNYHYYDYCRRSNVYHNPRAHKLYYGQRMSSGYVEKTIPQNNERGQQDGKIINQPRNNGSGNGNRIPNSQQGKSGQRDNSPRIQNQQPVQKQKRNNGQPGQNNPGAQPSGNPGGVQPRQSSPRIQPGNGGGGIQRGGGGGAGGGRGGGGGGRRR
jgi:hypothetical protein